MLWKIWHTYEKYVFRDSHIDENAEYNSELRKLITDDELALHSMEL